MANVKVTVSHLDVLERGVLAEQGRGHHHLVLAGVQLPHGQDVGLLTPRQAGVPHLRRARHVARSLLHVAGTAVLIHLVEKLAI